MYFHYFIIISPWKRAGPFIWTNLNPLHPGILCAKFGSNWPTTDLEKKMKMWKVYRQTNGRTDGRTDDGRQVIRKAHLSFQLRWAKKAKHMNMMPHPPRRFQGNINTMLKCITASWRNQLTANYTFIVHNIWYCRQDFKWQF